MRWKRATEEILTVFLMKSSLLARFCATSSADGSLLPCACGADDVGSGWGPFPFDDDNGRDSLDGCLDVTDMLDLLQSAINCFYSPEQEQVP